MGFSLQVSFGAMPHSGSVAYCGKGILQHRTCGRHRDLFPFSKGYPAVHESVTGTTGCSKSLCAPDDYSTKNTQKYLRHFQSHSECRPCYTVFENTILGVNVWRLAGDTLNITCNFLYCNHQVHRDFLITPYLHFREE
jgi:hypothetical protein